MVSTSMSEVASTAHSFLFGSPGCFGRSTGGEDGLRALLFHFLRLQVIVWSWRIVGLSSSSSGSRTSKVLFSFRVVSGRESLSRGGPVWGVFVSHSGKG